MIKIANLTVDNSAPFLLIAGPCQLERLDHAQFLVDHLKHICERHGIPFVFKGSFDKANRTSLNSQRGVGLHGGLIIMEKIREQFDVPVLTDVHDESQVQSVAQVVDVIQIPAFLCRQTSLLQEVSKQAKAFGRAVNVKKGQFLAPWDMQHVVDKITANGFQDLMLCERGTSFGYNTLVSDLTSLPIMAQTGFPVVYDATHSVQKPGGLGGSSGGNREMVPYLARAALAVGVAGLFLETHEDPDNAPSDGPNMVRLDHMDQLLEDLVQYDRLTKGL